MSVKNGTQNLVRMYFTKKKEKKCLKEPAAIEGKKQKQEIQKEYKKLQTNFVIFYLINFSLNTKFSPLKISNLKIPNQHITHLTGEMHTPCQTLPPPTQKTTNDQISCAFPLLNTKFSFPKFFNLPTEMIKNFVNLV